MVAMVLATVGSVAAQEPATEAPAYGESLEVTLVTTSVYVVDAKGAPVTDLRAEEVEVRIGGQLLPLANFDRATEPVPLAETVEGRAAVAAPPPATVPAAVTRRVFLLFDLAFLLPRGVEAAKRVAGGLLDQLPASDELYLVLYEPGMGLKQVLGPVRDAAGRQALRERIGSLAPSPRAPHRREELPPIVVAGKWGDAGAAVGGYENAHDTVRGAYSAQGAALADALETFATFLRQVPGDKAVLLFTDGIDSDIFSGVASGQPFDSETATRRVGLRAKFEPALQALKRSGALLFLVDPIVGFEPGDRVEGVAADAEARWVEDEPTGGGTLELMRQETGAVLVRHADTVTLERRLSGWMRGRYELGVYLAANAGGAPLAADIRVKRPGVRAWTASWLQPPRSVRDLEPAERAFLAVQLVMSGDPRTALRNVASHGLLPLEGAPSWARRGSELQLRLEPAAWPEELLLRGLELYSIVVAPGSPPRLARLERRNVTITPTPAAIEQKVAAQPGLVWGLVAFDVADGTIYLGRFTEPAQPAV